MTAVYDVGPVLMRVLSREDDGRVVVELLPDDLTIKLGAGGEFNTTDEFLTGIFTIDPFTESLTVEGET